VVAMMAYGDELRSGMCVKLVMWLQVMVSETDGNAMKDRIDATVETIFESLSKVTSPPLVAS
jgi:hypothetical protein